MSDWNKASKEREINLVRTESNRWVWRDRGYLASDEKEEQVVVARDLSIGWRPTLVKSWWSCWCKEGTDWAVPRKQERELRLRAVPSCWLIRPKRVRTSKFWWKVISTKLIGPKEQTWWERSDTVRCAFRHKRTNQRARRSYDSPFQWSRESFANDTHCFQKKSRKINKYQS